MFLASFCFIGSHGLGWVCLWLFLWYVGMKDEGMLTIQMRYLILYIPPLVGMGAAQLGFGYHFPKAQMEWEH